MTVPLTRSTKLLLTVRNEAEIKLKPSTTATNTAKIPVSSGKRRLRRCIDLFATGAGSIVLAAHLECGWRHALLHG